MYCPKCSEKSLITNAKFCKKCGSELVEDSFDLKDKNLINKKVKYLLLIPLAVIIVAAGYYFIFRDDTSSVKTISSTLSNNTSSKSDKNNQTNQKTTEEKNDTAVGEEQSKKTDETINKINSIINNSQGKYSISYQSLIDSDNIEINSRKTKSASVIKIFIMAEAFNQVKNGALDENREITLTDEMKTQGSGVLLKMESGRRFTISELIEYMIDYSDNTAANILIDILGMGKINDTIQNLGCTDSSLQRKLMDTDSISRGYDNYTSAKDLCLVFSKIYKNTFLGQEYDNKMIEILKKQKNNVKIPALLPQDTVIAHKTGELEKVENDAGIVFSPKGAYVVCFLTEDTPNEEAKKNISEISKIIYEYKSSN